MDEFERHPKIVAATKDGTTEYWASTHLQEHAVDSVRSELPTGWRLELTNRRLDLNEAVALKMGRQQVRKLPPGAKFLG